ncbi:MAG: hypothetical protein ACKVZJ_06650 [Phycisphaerales bacterium]
MSDRMYCRSCCYELSGLADAATADVGHQCPECGRGYVPSQPKTWQGIARTPFMQFVFGRGGAVGIAAILGSVAVWLTWLPRPDALDFSLMPVMRSWSMWRWMGDRYGWERTRLAGDPIEVRYFADRATAIRGRDNSGGTPWEVRDLGQGVARVSLFEPGCDYRTIIAATRRCQEWPDEFWRFSRGRLRTSAGPGVFEGPWESMVVNLAEHFRLTQLPTVLGEEKTHLHVLVPAADSGAERELELRRVSVSEAREMGLRVRTVEPGMFGIGVVVP